MKTILEIKFHSTEEEGLRIFSQSFPNFSPKTDTYIGVGKITYYQCKSCFCYDSKHGIWSVNFGKDCQENAEYVLVGISELPLEENEISLIHVCAWNEDGEYEVYSAYCIEVQKFGSFTYQR